MKLTVFYVGLVVLLAFPLLPTLVGYDPVTDGASLLAKSALGENFAVGTFAHVMLVSFLLFLLLYLGFPLYRFGQGLLPSKPRSQLRSLPNTDYSTQEWRMHCLWLVAPAVWIALFLYVMWVFHIYVGLSYILVSGYASWIVIWVVVVFVVLTAWLLLGGVVSLVRHRNDARMRKMSTSKLLFGLYYLVLPVALFCVLLLMIDAGFFEKSGSSGGGLAFVSKGL